HTHRIVGAAGGCRGQNVGTLADHLFRTGKQEQAEHSGRAGEQKMLNGWEFHETFDCVLAASVMIIFGLWPAFLSWLFLSRLYLGSIIRGTFLSGHFLDMPEPRMKTLL